MITSRNQPQAETRTNADFEDCQAFPDEGVIETRMLDFEALQASRRGMYWSRQDVGTWNSKLSVCCNKITGYSRY